MAPVVRPAFDAIVRREAFTKPFSRNSFLALSSIFAFVSAAYSLMDLFYIGKSIKVNKF
jgi:hypothetical protein